MGILDNFSHVCSITETKEALKLRKKRPLQVRTYIRSSSTSLSIIYILITARVSS
jgi:hypothetical protein